MATRHLGDLSTPKPVVEATFDYFGNTYRVNPMLTDLAMITFMREAREWDVEELIGKPIADVELRAEHWKMVERFVDFLAEQVHPEDWASLLATAKANGQRMEDLMVLSWRLGEMLSKDVTGFPTGPSPASSAGPTSTPPRSTGDSRSPVLPYEGALRATAGRPDLQLGILRKAAEEGIPTPLAQLAN